MSVASAAPDKLTLGDYRYPSSVQRFPTLSQSKLSAFDHCALTARFEAEYRRGWSTKQQARGAIFHRVAAECLRTMLSMRETSIPVDAALSILQDVLRQDEVDRVCPHCGSEEIRSGISEKGRRRCGACNRSFGTDFLNIPSDQVKQLVWCVIKWASGNEFDIQNLVEVERKFEALAYYPGARGGMVPRKLTGKLDAVFLHNGDPTHLLVPDWKDTWSLPPPHEERDDEISDEGYFQQRFYAWLLMWNFRAVEQVTLRENYIRYGQTREATITREDFEQITNELGALAERFDRAFAEGLFPPTAGTHCSFCIRPAACPIPQFARGEGRITDPARAKDVAWQIIAAEKVLKDARAAMRAFCDTQGPVEVKTEKGVRYMGYVATTRTSRPAIEEIEKAEREKGGPLTSVEIRGLYRRVPATRFQQFTPRPGDLPEGVDEEITRQLEASLAEAKERSGGTVRAPS